MQQRSEQRHQVARDLLVALCGGVDSIALHTAWHTIDVLKQKREKRHMILTAQHRVDIVELADVVRSIVGRQRDAAEHNLNSSMLQRRDDLIEISARAVEGKAAQAIIAAEGDDDNNRLERKHIVQSVKTVLCCVSANAGVHHAIVKALLVEVLLQKIRIAVAGIRSIPCCKAVAECDNDRTIVTGLRSGLGRRSGRRASFRCWRRSGFSLAANDSNRERNNKTKPQMGTSGAHHTFNLAVERRWDEGARGEGAA